MNIWKKNVVAAAVLVTVCAGIYLNWLYTDTEQTAQLTDTLNEEKILSDDMLVISSDAAVEAAAEDLSESGELSDYFAAVRLSRQEARDSAVSMLQEAMAYSEDGIENASNDTLEGIVQTNCAERGADRKSHHCKGICRLCCLHERRWYFGCCGSAGRWSGTV